MEPFLPIGAHLVTPRKWYSHHGVYVGNGRVVHYAGLSRAFHRGPIEETSLESFARQFGFAVRPHVAPAFSPDEIVRRAKARLGENRYAIITNNCEHFCEWCIGGRAKSSQIEALLKIPAHLARRLATSVRRLAERARLDASDTGRARA